MDDLSSDIPGGSTVTNDVYLGQRIMLLTGANMSGKSTLMRSVMAVALLGNLGLPVPCKSATVPQVCYCSRNWHEQHAAFRPLVLCVGSSKGIHVSPA